MDTKFSIIKDVRWDTYVSLQGAVFFVVCLTTAFEPLYSIRTVSASLSSDESQGVLHCKFMQATTDDVECSHIQGWNACSDTSYQDGSCQQMFAQLETVDAYVDLCMICFLVIIALSGITTFVSFGIEVIRKYVFTNIEVVYNVIVLLHLIAALFGVIVVQQTASIIEKTKYSNLNGTGQVPEFGTGTYVLATVPLVMLLLDTMYRHEIIPN